MRNTTTTELTTVPNYKIGYEVVQTCNCARVVADSMPSSAMSNTWPSKVRPITKLFGRFLEWLATVKREQSFFWHKNSNEASSSNGCMFSFFRAIIFPNGLRMAHNSFKQSPTVSDVRVPLKKRTFFVFSTCVRNVPRCEGVRMA